MPASRLLGKRVLEKSGLRARCMHSVTAGNNRLLLLIAARFLEPHRKCTVRSRKGSLHWCYNVHHGDFERSEKARCSLMKSYAAGIGAAPLLRVLQEGELNVWRQLYHKVRLSNYLCFGSRYQNNGRFR